MFDVVMPDKNEESFIDIATALGYTEICFLIRDMNYNYKSERIKVKKAYLIKNTTEINKARKKFDYIFADASRNTFESKPDYIINAEDHDGRDSLHYRKTRLNQVHAKLAKDNNIQIAYSFAKLINANLKNKQTILGRMMQNAKISKKYKLDTASFTLAQEPMMMRSRIILDAFSKIL